MVNPLKWRESWEELGEEFEGIRKIRRKRISKGRLKSSARRAKRKAKRITKRHPKAPKIVARKIKKMRVLVEPTPLSQRGEFAKRTEISIPSTAIFWMEYYPEHKRLIIAFRVSGEYYTYYNFPLNVFQAFRLAPSKGRFFNKRIRGSYAYKRGADRP